MSSTIAALSTPNGESAIALIRLTGDKCQKLAEDVFNKQSISPRFAYRGAYKNINGDILDDCVFTFYKAPASYTGEDMLEISTHGNPFITQSVLEDLFERGCQSAAAGEFTRRAFMNDKMDLSQAEAVSLLISARSQRSLNAAQKQLSGDLGKRIGELCDELMDICALVEAYIDFPEEDLPAEDKLRISNTAQDLSAKIQKLIDTSKYTPLIHQGLNIVIAGAPNAGKSSLMNELLGQNRAIVSPHAGTTRDFINEKIIISGYTINLTDTAGLHEAAGEIEALGIGKAVEKISAADICLLTLDTTADIVDIPHEASINMNAKNTIAVLNKCDCPKSDCEKFEAAYKDFGSVRISCATSAGIDNLREAIANLIKKYHITAAADDILVSARHAQALKRAKDAISNASKKIADNMPSELAASDLREALDAFGEIVGKTDNEEILDRIFSKFCIGK